MDGKDKLITMLGEVFGRWEEALEAVSEPQITDPQLVANWSVKYVIAHLWAWQRLSIARLEAALLDREPEFSEWPAELDPDSEDDVDQINALIYRTYHGKPWSNVHRDWRDGFTRFLELAEAIPEKDLLEPARYAWLRGHPLSLVLLGSCEHHQEHLEPLLAWLRQRSR